jgi:hypothetical protein
MVSWVPQGPRPNTLGQVEQIAHREVVGAVQAIAAHPFDPDIAYVGAVNGGVWLTNDAMAASPSWESLTDSLASLSIGALAFDPTDPTNDTLASGTGRFSSLRRTGGTAELSGLHICAVAPRDNIIVVAANNGGVFRSADTGATWQRVSGTPGTGLPAGISFDLAGDPRDPDLLYAHAGTAGIFRSSDAGGTWTKISNAVIDSLLVPATARVRISVGMNNNVYIAIANPGPEGGAQLAGLFRSANGGGAWAALALPSTVENAGVMFGIHPGGQAGIHLSLAADRDDPNIVYIGGDRQPGFNEGAPGASRWPNSLGARDYSGRLFRINASRPLPQQAEPLTHRGTASGSSPHADSRNMAIAANGVLIEVDDGGIYRRTNPGNAAGDWFSMNGRLQTTEFHAAAWDASTHTIIGGAQDTGSPQQLQRADARWQSVSTADGDVAAADAESIAGQSTRYSSWQYLGGLRREVYDAAGAFVSQTAVLLQALGGGAPIAPQFYTPFELNQVTPTRLILGAANGIYESDDEGDTVTAIAPGRVVNNTGPIGYGAAGNADALYVGSGNEVFIRTSAHPTPLAKSPAYPSTGIVVGIALQRDDPLSAYVVEALRAYRTIDGGATWGDITNTLLTLGGGVLRSVAHCADLNGGSVIVGTNAGVFAAAPPAFAWASLGTDLPNVPILRLQYAAPDRVLLAGTLGRGAWTLDI